MSNSLNNASTNLLAQYLAREQLTVVHNATASTASIDLANRVLELPTWDTSKVGAQAKPVYHGLVGHEVAHALHTPADQWLTAQSEIAGANSSDRAKAVAQDFVNVVEDARIEKMIVREFPGLKSDFAHMYDTMWKMDAFGCKGKDLSEMRFIDRLNLHFKVGKHAGVAVPFSDEEQEIIKRIDRAVSFRDVIDIAKDLYNTAKQEEEEQNDPQGDDGQQTQPGNKQDGQNGKKNQPCNPGEKGESSQSDSQSDDSQDGDEQESEGNGKGDAQDDGDEDGESGSSSDGDGDEDGNDSNAESQDGTDGSEDKSSKDAEKNEFDPNAKGKVADRHTNADTDIVPLGSTTQQNLSKFVNGLVNVKIDEEPIRVPNIDPTDIVVDCADFVKLVDSTAHVPSYYGSQSKNINVAQEVEEQSLALFAEMTKKEKSAVDLMVRQFELRKAAKDFARQSSCKTGRISPRHLAKYKFSEDIFDRVTIKRDEKNHGIVILLDWSGSMSPIISEVVSQVGGILQFCRRAGIPAEVYFFNSMYNKWAEERFNKNPALCGSGNNKRTRQDALRYGIGGFGSSENWMVAEAMDFTDRVCHLPAGTTAKGGHVILKAFSLIKVYDAKMDNRKFASTYGRLLLLANTYGSRSGRCEGFKGNIGFGECLNMGDTPLDESILAMREVVSKFRKSSNSKVTFISMSDGEGQGLTNMYSYTKRGQVRGSEKAQKTVTAVLIDGRNGRRYENGKLDRGYARDKTHNTCVEMFRDATDCEIVGIMMVPGKRANLSYISMYSQNFPKFKDHKDAQVKRDADEKQFTDEGYLAVPVDGYNSYFFLSVTTAFDIAREQEKERRRLDALKNRKMAIERQMILDGEKNQSNRAFINRLMGIVA